MSTRRHTKLVEASKKKRKILIVHASSLSLCNHGPALQRSSGPPCPMDRGGATQAVEHGFLCRTESWPPRVEHCRQSRRGSRAIHRASIAAGLCPYHKSRILLAKPSLKPSLLPANAIRVIAMHLDSPSTHRTLSPHPTAAATTTPRPSLIAAAAVVVTTGGITAMIGNATNNNPDNKCIPVNMLLWVQLPVSYTHLTLPTKA